MAIKPATVVEYSREFQQIDIAPERVQKIADEVARLVDGIAAIAGAASFADAPEDFLAALAELRDTAGAGDE